MQDVIVSFGVLSVQGMMSQHAVQSQHGVLDSSAFILWQFLSAEENVACAEMVVPLIHWPGGSSSNNISN